MKYRILMAFSMILLTQPTVAQAVYQTDKGHVSFFSKAPISDVDAHNGSAKIRLNTSTRELIIDISMKDFEFRNGKMGRDARDKYIEVEEFPKAGFRGKIATDINYKKPGTYPATAAGTLTIHGTDKQITEKGTVTVDEKTIRLEAGFNVLLKDFNIETPSILGQEMTGDNVLVKFEATLNGGNY